MGGLLWTLIVICIVGWVIGLALHVTLWFIHLLLVGAVVLFVINLVTGRKSAA